VSRRANGDGSIWQRKDGRWCAAYFVPTPAGGRLRVPVAVISAWLGHATADFTMRTYVHSQNEALRMAATAPGTVTGT
jgi:hypothetical protein